MNRREFLQCGALIAAGASQAPATWALSPKQSDFLAAQPPYINRVQLNLFSATQRQLVTTVAEHIIPATETPGATDAGVPKFVESMVATWFNDAERNRFMQGLRELDKTSGGFVDLSVDEQLAVLEKEEEAAAADAAWFDTGSTFRIWDDTAPFICQFKELTVLGFMLSEKGTKEFLRPNPMGTFKGDIPLADGDAAYAVDKPMRMLSSPLQNNESE